MPPVGATSVMSSKAKDSIHPVSTLLYCLVTRKTDLLDSADERHCVNSVSLKFDGDKSKA